METSSFLPYRSDKTLMERFPPKAPHAFAWCQSLVKDLGRRGVNGRRAHQRAEQRPAARSELMMTYNADAHSAA